MLFNSYTFAIFALAFYALYRVLNHTWQNRLILVGSSIFYGAWDWRFLGLLWSTIAIDFLVARRLAAIDDQRVRRMLMCVSLFSNLGMLAFFKYFDFFAENLQLLLVALGFSISPFILQLVLPVGISFYTLHTLGYVLDVYNRRELPVSSLIDFACFVAFFPLLVAGPIVRIGQMRRQFAEPA